MQLLSDFLSSLNRYPVIASARDLDAVKRTQGTDIECVFLLGGSILTLSDMVKCARDVGKRVFIHLDLLGGLGRDNVAVEWCATTVKPDGIISTRVPLLKKASSFGLVTIQRLFVMDSASLSHGVNLFKSYSPDMLEVLPGLVPKAITQLQQELNKPIIAGGMVTERGEIEQALKAGASGVSTSIESLWHREG